MREMAGSDGWGEVFARIDKQNGIHASVRGIHAIAFDRDAEKIDDTLPVDVVIDGSKATFQAGQAIEMHKVNDGWLPGPAARTKRASSTPICCSSPTRPCLIRRGAVFGRERMPLTRGIARLPMLPGNGSG